MRNDIERHFDFGIGGTAEELCLYGWHGPEPGFTWTADLESALLLPRLPAPSGWFVELRFLPLLVRDVVVTQHVTLSVNGIPVGNSVFYRIRRENVAYYVPPSSEHARGAGARSVLMRIDHPDAARPSDLGPVLDTRRLALAMQSLLIHALDEPLWPAPMQLPEFADIGNARDEAAAIAAVEPRVGMPASELVVQFEPLGANCEFGLLQRLCGAEPLGLLRFSSAFIKQLILAIDGEFAELGDQLDMRLSDDGLEWIATDQTYLFAWHTFISPEDATEEKVRAGELAKMRLLRRKLIDDMADGRKIFVYQRYTPLTADEIAPLFLALRRHGPNTLLWVTLADDEHPSGTIEVVAPGLIRGNIDRNGGRPDASWDISVGCWLEILARTISLRRQVIDPVADAMEGSLHG